MEMAADDKEVIVINDSSDDPALFPSTSIQSLRAQASTLMAVESNEDLCLSHMDRSRASSASAVNRKRKANSLEGTVPKKKKIELKMITPGERAAQFASDHLCVSNGASQESSPILTAGKLFCKGCRKTLSMKLSTIQSHINSNTHVSNVEKLRREREKQTDMADFVQV